MDPTRAREVWLHDQIRKIREELQERVQPFVEELARIQASRGPPDMLLPDGRLMRYVGPKYEYMPPEDPEEAPKNSRNYPFYKNQEKIK